jgi:hypothetical protein
MVAQATPLTLETSNIQGNGAAGRYFKAKAVFGIRMLDSRLKSRQAGTIGRNAS